MITENLSTLKIHKLTQAQYDRELETGRIDESAIYLTPDELQDLSIYATVEQMNGKADENHSHNTLDMSALNVENLSVGGIDIAQLIENIVKQMMDAGRIIDTQGGDTNE